jgi:hypothetical protein
VPGEREVRVVRRLRKGVKNQGGSKKREDKGTCSGRIKEKNNSSLDTRQS